MDSPGPRKRALGMEKKDKSNQIKPKGKPVKSPFNNPEIFFRFILLAKSEKGHRTRF